ncbi:DUF6083 domain-containing protein [Streptomyces sp. Root431]|uniref:DUF6083 domain-containing protein n=1 Tax=Streptomyces sp. Root431 TaxID=1736535 RepID=UPI000ADE1A6F|nr:DUF6083 domain-containing protein [Streptomyces sp. Root431]
MISGRWSDACEVCGAPYGSWIANLGMALCGTCERAGSDRPVREPVLVGDVLAGMTAAVTIAARTGRAVPDPRRPSTGTCDGCGAGAAWHRTLRGRWVLMEPGELAARVVPAGRRWRIAGDGTAVALGSAVPSDTCRISHFDVCPARPAPADSPTLLALWRGHARRHRAR